MTSLACTANKPIKVWGGVREAVEDSVLSTRRFHSTCKFSLSCFFALSSFGMQNVRYFKD